MILPAKILRLAIKKLSLMVVIILRTFIDGDKGDFTRNNQNENKNVRITLRRSQISNIFRYLCDNVKGKSFVSHQDML